MAVAFAPTMRQPLPWSHCGVWVGIIVEEPSRLKRAVRLAEAGVAAYLVAGPVRAIGRILLFPDPGPVVPALVAAALCLVLIVWLVWPAVHGRRPAGARWLLLAMAAIVVAASTGGLGSTVGEIYGCLGLAILIVVRPPWSWIWFVVAVAAPLPLGAYFGAVYGFPRSDISLVLFGGLSIAPFLLIWLVAAVRERDEARAALAAEAVLQERTRIENELRQTIGAELEAIVERGERAGAPAQEAAAVETQLRELVGASRYALGRARRIVSGYQRMSLRSELDTAASLLRAAGIDTRIVAPDTLPDGAGAAQLRTRLRAAIAVLLRSADVRSCVITVTAHGDVAEIDVVPDGERLPTTRVAAP